MHDVAMRRRLAALVIAAAVALLVVGGAMLFGMGKPAQAQSDPEPPCNFNFCLDKTANPSTVTVGEQITFTITERCPQSGSCGNFRSLEDTLPSGLSIVSVDANEPTKPGYQCTTSENTVTCPGLRDFHSTAPFTLTIVATTTECGTFTNTANNGVDTAEASFTVNCVPTDTQAPKVISTFPRNEGEVGPAANIRAAFSEEMRPASVKEAFKLFKKGSTTKIAAAVTYDAATDTATLNPNENLRRGATYKAVVSTLAKDEAGNRLDQNPSLERLQKKVWFFEIDN
jgi:Bacterial Ig-like domain